MFWVWSSGCEVPFRSLPFWWAYFKSRGMQTSWLRVVAVRSKSFLGVQIESGSDFILYTDNRKLWLEHYGYNRLMFHLVVRRTQGIILTLPQRTSPPLWCHSDVWAYRWRLRSSKSMSNDLHQFILIFVRQGHVNMYMLSFSCIKKNKYINLMLLVCGEWISPSEVV